MEPLHLREGDRQRLVAKPVVRWIERGGDRVDADTSPLHVGEQIGELRIYVAVRLEALDIGPLDDKDDVSFGTVLVQCLETSEVAAAALGLPVGELGDAILDVRAGFDFYVDRVVGRRCQQEIRPPVVREVWFPSSERVLRKRGESIARQYALEQVIRQSRSEAHVRPVDADGDGIVVCYPVRVIDRRAQDLSTRFEDAFERAGVTQEHAFWRVRKANANDESVRTVHDRSRHEGIVDCKQRPHASLSPVWACLDTNCSNQFRDTTSYCRVMALESTTRARCGPELGFDGDSSLEASGFKPVTEPVSTDRAGPSSVDVPDCWEGSLSIRDVEQLIALDPCVFDVSKLGLDLVDVAVLCDRVIRRVRWNRAIVPDDKFDRAVLDDKGYLDVGPDPVAISGAELERIEQRGSRLVRVDCERVGIDFERRASVKRAELKRETSTHSEHSTVRLVYRAGHATNLHHPLRTCQSLRS